MSEHQANHRLSLVSWLLVITPALLLVGFITLAAHVRIGLGHWPTPMIENYDTAAYWIHDRVLVWVGMFTVFAAIPLWLLTLCFQRFRISLKTHLIQAGVYACGWGLIALYGAVDPGRFMEWFLD